MKKTLWLFVLASFMLVSVHADQLNLKDGTVLKGKIIQLHEGKIKIKTDFSGEVVVDRSKVSSFSTVEPLVITTNNSASSVTGKVFAGEDGKIVVNDMVINNSDLKNFWQPGQPDPSIPVIKSRKWAYEVAFDVSGKTGNTEKSAVGGSAKATLDGPDDKLALYLRGKYAKENGTKNEEEIVGGADYEFRFAKTSNTGYARTELERDKINDYKLYWTSAVGYGYYLMDKPDYKIRLRAGLTYVKKDYYSDLEDDSSMGIEFNYHHELRIKDFGKLITDVTYTPVFDNFQEDYRIYHESAIDIPLNKSGLWSIRLGISNEYNNRVASGNDRLDTTYFGRLVISWD